MELVLADLESVEKRLPRIEKLARQKDKTAENGSAYFNNY